ncbi:MAG: YtxH domain-containing protein [Bacteroidales bacterium]|nr:YtxH domain-containing protein [Bacteroidales bacterium]
MNSGKIILGTLAGVVIGAALGVLFAPDKGSNTRKKIIGKLEDFTNEMKNNLDDAMNDIIQSAENLTDEISQTSADDSNQTG